LNSEIIRFYSVSFQSCLYLLQYILFRVTVNYMVKVFHNITSTVRAAEFIYLFFKSHFIFNLYYYIEQIVCNVYSDM
jgi:hypothetical protein